MSVATGVLDKFALIFSWILSRDPNTLLNLLIVCVTALSVWYVRRRWISDRRAQIIATFQIKRHTVFLEIENIGKSYARDISIDLIPSMSNILNQDTEDLAFYTSPIKSMAPGEKYRRALVHTISEDLDKEIEIEVSYKDRFGNYSLRHTYYLKNLEGQKLERTPLRKINKNLKKLSKNVKDIKRTYKRS